MSRPRAEVVHDYYLRVQKPARQAPEVQAQIKEAKRRSYIKHRERVRAQSKKWREENPERAKELSRRGALKKIGWTQNQVDAAFLRQAGCCAICGKPGKVTRIQPTGLVADHCHTTGKPRALLCNRCNVLEGDADYLAAILPRIFAYRADWADKHAEPNE